MGLAVLQLLLTVFTAMVGLFTDGGDIFSRLILSILHPVAALAILVLIFRPTTPVPITVAVAVLLAINILADVMLSTMIGIGAMKGDWELPLVFAAVPTVAMIYAMLQLRSRQVRPEGEYRDAGCGV